MPRRPIVPGNDGTRSETPGGEHELREVLARWTTGVAIVAARVDGAVHAMTVTAFLPLSLRPPLVGVAIGQHAPLVTMLEEGTAFIVNLLGESQRRWANVFADSFAADPGGFTPTGDPVLEGCIGALNCLVTGRQPAGDHILVTGEVRSALAGGDERPLLYFDRRYRGLGEEA